MRRNFQRKISMKPKNGNLKLAIQKEGRLTEDTINLLHTAGLEFEGFKQRQRLFSPCRNFPLEILSVRDDDIPNYVEMGTADLGIVGRDLLIEKGSRVKELLGLNFGFCTLTIAVPESSRMKDIQELANTRIATSYPRATKDYFRKMKIPIKVFSLSGSVEIAPTIGVADAITDLVSTGSSLGLHELKALATIFTSEAVFLANPKSIKDKRKNLIIERLVTRFKGVLSAKKYKYVMMNVPEEALKKIEKLAPGLKSPTVVPLMKKGWFAVHSVLEEETFWEVVEKMKKIGAQGILVSPLEKIIF